MPDPDTDDTLARRHAVTDSIAAAVDAMRAPLPATLPVPATPGFDQGSRGAVTGPPVEPWRAAGDAYEQAKALYGRREHLRAPVIYTKSAKDASND